MVRTRGFRSSRQWFIRAGVATLFVAFLIGTAQADDPVYIKPDGSQYRMVKADSELAVFLKNVSETEGTARRLSTTRRGVLENIWSDPGVGLKKLIVADTGIERRERISADENIEEVRPIYYFEGYDDTPVIPSGQLVFRLKSDAPEGTLGNLITQYGLIDVRKGQGVPNMYLADVNKLGDEIPLAQRMSSEPHVKWAQPNLISPIRKHQFAGAQDEYIDEQWHLEVIEADGAWLTAGGQDVLFGIFDDAVDVFHEDLRDNYIGEGQDASLETNAEGYTDPRPKLIGDRHGTSVLGLAVAASNTFGVRGVSHQARFTASRGLSQPLTDFEVASVFTFARQQSVDVHINSWGLPRPNPSVVVDAIETAFNEGRVIDDRPYGMVILFATGNDDVENDEGSDLSSLPTVIGVGASNSADSRASYSNYGRFINILAPSGDEGDLEFLVTTDNTDAFGYAEDGYNQAGFDDFGFPNLDSEGRYTNDFSGTSGACPVAAGVAGLILSSNQLLTATDVRLIIEHTADQISPEDAGYGSITSRSDKYGYGRINARRAVEAARETITNGGFTWPERVSGVGIVGTADGNFLTFTQQYGTDEFLIVEGDNEFSFVPQDEECYSSEQSGCGSQALTDLPDGVRVIFTECAIGNEGCEIGASHSLEFDPPTSGLKYFGIYSRNLVGRYAFGVAVDSDGNVFGEKPGDNNGGGGSTPDDDDIAVSILASPLSGTSPLTVSFTANAISDQPVDIARTLWEFGDGSTAVGERNLAHTYVADQGTEQRYTARLTMYDTEGNSDSDEIIIIVRGEGQSGDDGSIPTVRIVVGTQGTVDSDKARGPSPFDVLLSVDASNLNGEVRSVEWDLGDGTTATSLVVPHTYINDVDETEVKFLVTATVRVRLSNAVENLITTSRVVTVDGTEPDSSDPDTNLDGTGADGAGGAACGGFGMITPMLLFFSLAAMRRRF